MAGVLYEVRQSGAHTPIHSSLMEALVDRSILHVYVQEEEWEVVYRMMSLCKESETERVIILRKDPWRSRCAQEFAKQIPTAPTHRQTRSVNFLIEFMIKSASSDCC